MGIQASSQTETAGTVALAYAAHKAASPIRFPPTVALTPFVANAIVSYCVCGLAFMNWWQEADRLESDLSVYTGKEACGGGRGIRVSSSGSSSGMGMGNCVGGGRRVMVRVRIVATEAESLGATETGRSAWLFVEQRIKHEPLHATVCMQD